MQPVITEKAWYRELEAAAHMASTVRKQRLMDAGALSLLSPFYSVQDPSLWNGTPTISLSPIWTLPYSHDQRSVPSVILDPTTLVIILPITSG